LHDKIKKNGTVVTCQTYGERKVAYRDVVETPKGKGPLGRLRHRPENIKKIDFQEVK